MTTTDSYVDTAPRTRTHMPAVHPPVARRGRTLRAAVLGGILAFLVVVLLLAGLSHHRPAKTSSPPTAVPPAIGSTAVTPRTVAGVPVGYPDTSAGAEAAAANYVVAFAGQGMFTTATRHQIIAAVADPAVSAAMQTQDDAAYAASQARFGLDASGQPPHGQQFVARALPVGVRLEAYTPTTARVSVWSDGLIGLAGTGSIMPVSEAWTTADVSLEWVDGDWKWLTATQTDGPTPVSGLQSPSTAAAIASAIRTYGGLTYEP